MNKKIFFIITTIVLLISNLLLIGFFVKHKPGKGKAHEPKKMIISKLNFDDQQITKYDKLIEAHQVSVIEIEDQISNLKTGLYAQLDERENPVERDSLLQALQVKLSNREMIHYNHFIGIKKICTPVQLPAFAKLMEDVQDVFMRRNPRLQKQDKR